MSRPLADLRCLYLTGEEIVASELADDVARALVRTAFGRTIEGEIADGIARFRDIPTGTHVVELHTAAGAVLAEEIVSVRDDPGQDPILGFATTFEEAAVPAILDWLQQLRCTAVQIYDWMASYSEPLGSSCVYHDALGRKIERGALEALTAGIRRLGAVAQAYAPVCAADPGTHAERRLQRNDGAPESLGDLLDIMNPGDAGWQRHWIDRYGRAADALGFNGFHLDTYGYPRCAVDSSGRIVPIADGYDSFIDAVRRARPSDVLSFNQVNGVPAGIMPPGSPGFRYVEVWPPNDRWRHLEGLMSRSAGRDSAPQGDTLAIYPPVWGEERADALRTVVLTEAVATMLGIGVLILGDARAALRHPYYVDNERLTAEEADEALIWRRFALRCRDLFRRGEDTSWFELDDENAAVTVDAAAAAKPEPLGGSLFTRVVRTDETLVVSLLDLSGSSDGSWSSGTRRGRCDHATVTALVDSPERWRAEVAVLGRDHGRFAPAELREGAHREGRAVVCDVPIAEGWSVLRLENGEG